MPVPRRVTAEELDAMVAAFRRDPGRGCVALGNAYLSLGRAREAIDAGAAGLKVAPDNLDARVMVAYAFSQLHQWKEAQAELLKVVKADRNHRYGFRLLGEVLMRRADYERALPVLQHAQNLAPADPAILTLLKRARLGQPLDPPPAMPTPVDPMPTGSGSREVSESGFGDDQPTRVAEGQQRGDDVLGRVGVERREVRSGGQRPAPVVDRAWDDRGQREAGRPLEMNPPPPRENPLAPLGADPRDAASTTGDLGGARPSAVRPRVMPLEKPKDAAAGALRQSVAVGEDYLNNLLASGLLEVPRVRVAERTYDVTPDRRWGRSTARVFVYLFVMLVLAVGGAGSWYWYAEQQRKEDVARYLVTATTHIELGDHAGLKAADEAAREAIKRDRTNPYAVAVLAQLTALEAMLYRELDPSEVAKAIGLAAEDIKTPSDKGFRELVVARAALALASLSPDEEGSDRRLADVQTELAAWLGGHGTDSLARWLQGEAFLAAGARTAAAAAFAEADKGDGGTVLATIALGDLRLDAGKYDEARGFYDAALARAPRHPWAFVGRSLVRSERSLELEDAMGDLSVGVAQEVGPRVAAYKHLAKATALFGLEDYGGFETELDLATGPGDPRFLARVGLLRLGQGRIAEAAAARAKVRWYAEKPEPDPLVGLLDAELLLARGLASAAHGLVVDRAGLRAARLRGRAMFDAGNMAAAVTELGAALESAPDDLETQTWLEAARVIAKTGEERRKADEALDSLGRKARSKVTRLAHGLALAAIGRTEDARTRLEQSLAELSAEYPNAMAYRSHVALAELDLAAGDLAAAQQHADKALEQNPGYLPTHDLLGRLLIDTAPEKARAHLTDVVSADVASPGAEIAFARLTIASDPAAAADALARARKKGATAAQFQAVYAAFPPEMMAKLGVAAPKPVKPPRRGR
jgi:tetratricopeptide (TPR) repeat protein